MQDTTMHTIMLLFTSLVLFQTMLVCMRQDKASDLCSLLCAFHALLVPFFQMLPPLKLFYSFVQNRFECVIGVYNSASFRA